MWIFYSLARYFFVRDEFIRNLARKQSQLHMPKVAQLWNQEKKKIFYVVHLVLNKIRVSFYRCSWEIFAYYYMFGGPMNNILFQKLPKCFLESFSFGVRNLKKLNSIYYLNKSDVPNKRMLESNSWSNRASVVWHTSLMLVHVKPRPHCVLIGSRNIILSSSHCGRYYQWGICLWDIVCSNLLF